MKRLLATIGVVVLATVATASAQQPVSPADPHHPPGQAQPPAAGPQTPSPAAPMAGMMPMMQMCQEMMSGHAMMGPGMMGGAQPADPKMMSQMMEMRGEMLKAMGDIMLKHAKRMQGRPAPTK